MTKLRVLFIDDDEGSLRLAKKWVQQNGYFYYFCEFRHFKAAVEECQPHIVILDRMKGNPPAADDEGAPVFEAIWNQKFCPVVIYSAFPEDDGDLRKAHPLVRKVPKGMDLTEFKTAFGELSQLADALENAEQHIRSQFAVALRDVAPYAAETFADPKERKDAIVRHGRRRLAALMDEITMGKLASWEQYIFPPVSGSLMLGDIIRLRDGNHKDAMAFRVILTPSCDMVSVGGRQPKAKFVLVARCCAPKQGIQGTSLCKILGDKDKLRDALIPSMLSQGFLQRMVPFPALRDKVPTMMADMKDLELIPIAGIDAGKSGASMYLRVAGLDSPFREEISWAYMQNACRPGMPDRDLEPWRNDIMDSCGA